MLSASTPTLLPIPTLSVNSTTWEATTKMGTPRQK
jgi:hypothetical protein